MKLFSQKNVKKYDKMYKSGHDHSYPNLDLVRILSSYIKPKNSNILDYGFGSGQNLIHLTKLNFKEIHGLEPSKEAIKLVKKKLKKNQKTKVNLRQLYSTENKLPYFSETFDNIICTSVLSLLEKKNKVKFLIQEFHRILKKNGKLIIDINGPKSDLRKGKLISFERERKKNKKIKKKQKIKTFYSKNLKDFSNLFHEFHVDELGEIKFKYFSFNEHEFIACLRKK